MMLMLTESMLFFINSWKTRTKSSLVGHVQNWRTVVPQKLPGSTASQSDSIASAQPPPSTIFSKSQKSVASVATSLNSYLNPPSTKGSALVGAFGDEDLDDSLEHDVALTTKAKVPMKVRQWLSTLSLY